MKYILKIIIKIILVYFFLYLFFNNGFAECSLTVNDIVYHYKLMLLEDLRKFVDTENFKVLNGYHKYITNDFLWNFLNDIDIIKLLSEKKDDCELIQETRKTFCEFIIKQKNKDFYFLISSISLCTFTDIVAIYKNANNIVDFGFLLNPINNENPFRRLRFVLEFSVFLYTIINKYLIYFGILIIMLLFPFLFTPDPFTLDISFLCHDQKDLLENIGRNPFLSLYDYKNTKGIIDKDLLSNIKKFFLPKQKGIF